MSARVRHCPEVHVYIQTRAAYPSLPLTFDAIKKNYTAMEEAYISNEELAQVRLLERKELRDGNRLLSGTVYIV